VLVVDSHITVVGVRMKDGNMAAETVADADSVVAEEDESTQEVPP